MNGRCVELSSVTVLQGGGSGIDPPEASMQSDREALSPLEMAMFAGEELPEPSSTALANVRRSDTWRTT